eukprot:TRINITY_DN94110_c0_g1_i1.p1 TRINITY_DN94110_c0_g1~~TRINITY_DN94110_c0_g1_i1.p1  ORF type:complete len:486 (+),score=101.20 TRINITY_DN94110_c0_g1_i1:51-1508(+)
MSGRIALPPTTPNPPARALRRKYGSNPLGPAKRVDNEGEAVLDAAKYVRIKAASSRQSRKAAENRVQVNHETFVEERLRAKLADTVSLRRSLEEYVVVLTAEIRKLEALRLRAQAKLNERLGPLSVAEERIAVRSQKPIKELQQAQRDTVERALEAEAAELRYSSEQLRSIITTADSHIEKMTLSIEALKADIADKEASIKLDQACLRLGPGAGDIVSFESGPKVELRKSNILPEIWKKGSLQELEQARELQHTSEAMRKTLGKILRHMDLYTTAASQAVTDALKSQVKKTSHLQLQLQQQLGEVEEELHRLEVEYATSHKQLQEAIAPLELVQQRILLRNHRPERESVRDSVEEALEAQQARLRQVVTTAQKTMSDIDAERQRLEVLRASLQAQVQDKASALQFESRFLDMHHQDDEDRPHKGALHSPHPPVESSSAVSPSAAAAKRRATFLKQAINALSHTRAPRACFLSQRDLGGTYVIGSR